MTDLIAYYEQINVKFARVSDLQVLKHLMEAKGVSQKELAEATGISKSTISEILGRHREMTLDHYRKFSEFFGVEPSAFMSPGKRKGKHR